MKRIRHFPMPIVLFACVGIAGAQSSFDLSAGVGSNYTKSSGIGLDTSTFEVCTPSPASPTCAANPELNGIFMGVGGEFMPWKHLGFGAEANFTPDRRQYFSAVYGQLTFRQTFYDFNAIYAPIDEKKFILKVMGGVGGAKTGFGFTTTSCVQNVVCSTSTQPVGSDNHPSVHVGVAPQIYLTQHVLDRKSVV